MPITRLQTLLFIAQNEGKDGALVRDIVRYTGLNQSTVARNLSFLSVKPTRGMQRAANFIEATPDPDDPRRMRVRTTEKGKRFIEEMLQITDLG